MRNIDKNECLIKGVQYKCRTCFDPGRTIYHLTEEAINKKTWLDLLKNVVQLQRADDEQLPKTLCCKCSEKLKRYYDFVLQIQNVNEKYSELLAKNDVVCNASNAADCLAESTITLPLEHYMPEIKLEEEMDMTYDINMTNNLKAESAERFENEDNGDPFDDKNATEALEENKSAIETAGKCTTKRELRKVKGSSENSVQKHMKRTRKAKQVKDIKVEKSEPKDEVQKIEDIGACGPIVCSKCPQTFFTLYAHLKHQKEDHSSEEFDDEKGKCPLCSKEFKSTYYVISHIKNVHDKLKPFKCSHCSKTFASAATRRNHEITHTDEFPHQCKFCQKRFRLLCKLKYHLEIHTTKPELLCPICKRGQKTQEELEAHIKNHENNRFQCPSCGKFFTRRPHLDDHYNAVHLKLKPYKCRTCDQSFGDPKSRRTHEKRHQKKDTSAS